jgi:inner membrane protein
MIRAYNPQAQAIFASPPPIAFWRRDLVWREDNCYRRSLYDPLQHGGLGTVSQCEPTNMRNPLVREAIHRDPSLQKFLKWSVLPQADVIRERCTARVTIGDARYGEGRRSRLARETVVPIKAPGCAVRLDKVAANS